MGSFFLVSVFLVVKWGFGIFFLLVVGGIRDIKCVKINDWVW